MLVMAADAERSIRRVQTARARVTVRHDAGALHVSVQDDGVVKPREREILQLLAEGKSNKDVANLLNLSVYTVETHRGNLMEKLNLHSVPELILYAVRKGVIS